jgi:uncharacterized membrane protein YedE/YeeE
MIRIAALGFGVLCGIGLIVASLYLPLHRGAVALPGGQWDATLGLGVLTAVIVAALMLRATSGLRRPLLGGEMEQGTPPRHWKTLAGGALFGLGWGIAGYHPLAALVSAGLFAPGAAVFLTSLLGGMILHDLLTGNRHLLRQQG